MIQNTVRNWEKIPVAAGDRFDTYFHALSHDLRTPLNHISGFAELLHLDDSLPLAQKEYAAVIVSACGELKKAVLDHLQLIERSLMGDLATSAMPPEPPIRVALRPSAKRA